MNKIDELLARVRADQGPSSPRQSSTPAPAAGTLWWTRAWIPVGNTSYLTSTPPVVLVDVDDERATARGTWVYDPQDEALPFEYWSAE